MIATWIWVLIPLAAIAAGVVHKWLAIKERQIHSANEAAARYAALTERLEERVRVLERIITDRGIQVADEIDMLRDAEDRGPRREGGV